MADKLPPMNPITEGIKFEPNQCRREMEGVIGLNSLRMHNSASRVQMFGSHIGQLPTILGGTQRYLQNGLDREYGKYTFSIKQPEKAVCFAVIDRYRPRSGKDYIASNPERVVIYENFETGEFGMVSIEDYCSHHSYFGFEYKKTNLFHYIKENDPIPEGAFYADSPAVMPDGGYCFGREMNVAYMSIPGTSEDGIIIADDVLQHLRIKTYERRTIEWGALAFALNLHGDEHNYKPFPDIGDWVDETGLLAVLREYDAELAPVQQSVQDCREVDYTFDKRVYAVAGLRGKVVDVKVEHDARNPHGRAPLGTEEQPMKYDRARRVFYTEILDAYKRMKKLRGERLRLTPQLNNLVKKALSVVGETKDHIHLLHKRAPLDDWRVEIVIEYEITPKDGFKLTDTSGGKGVICKVVPRSHMPIDEHGNSADIVMSAEGTVNRTNFARSYEQYYNAASRDVLRRIRQDLGIAKEEKKSIKLLREIEKTNPNRVQAAIDYLLGYYKILTPIQYNDMVSGTYTKPLIEHLAHVLDNGKNGIHLYLPPENPPETEQIVHDIEKYYPPLLGPVTYVGNSGRRITTKNNVRIGSVYILLLEKIADDWTAVSSGKLQHLGVLSQVTNADKNSQPNRSQAIRAQGESEVRNLVSYCGPLATAEILDRNNNPTTHKAVLEAILTADQPTNIPLAVDRNEIPLGSSRPLQLVKHMLEVGGVKFTYTNQGGIEKPTTPFGAHEAFDRLRQTSKPAAAPIDPFPNKPIPKEKVIPKPKSNAKYEMDEPVTLSPDFGGKDLLEGYDIMEDM